MSIIKLGRLATNITYDNDYNNYVAAIVNSQSGLTVPKLVRTVSELKTYFGDFDYDSMYSELLNAEIPVLLLPNLTEMSDLNRCTLRISVDQDGYIISHPKYGKKYKYNSQISNINSGEYSTYNCTLNFTEVDFDKLRTLSTSSGSDENLQYILICKDQSPSPIDKDNRVLIQFSAYVNGWGLSLNYFDVNTAKYLYEGSEWTESRVHDLTDIEVINEFRSTIETKLGTGNVECVNILDEVTEVLTNSLNEYDLNTIVDINTQLDRTDLKPEVREDLLEAREIEYGLIVNHISNSIYKTDFLNSNSYTVNNTVSTIINSASESIKNLHEVDGKTLSQQVLEFIMNLLTPAVTSNSTQLSLLKLSLKYKNKLDLPYFTDIEGLEITSEFSFNEDQESSRTENSKLIEFYSKIKGSQGSRTHIGITKGELPYSYRIDISNGDVTESFDVTTIVPTSKSLYYDVNTQYDYITIINDESNLVSIKYFDYLKNGIYYDQSDIDPDEFNSIEDYDQVFIPRELPITDIEFKDDIYLDRYVTEYPEYSDAVNTLKVFEESNWYPDLFLVTDVNYGNNNLDYLTRLNNYCISSKTQALVKLDKVHFIDIDNGCVLSSRLFDSLKLLPGSRLLTFYGDLTINDYIFPSFYPYIANILNSEFLRIPVEKLLYKLPDKLDQVLLSYGDPLDESSYVYNYSEDELPEINEDYLKSLGVNYFDYNNIYYNYKRIRECNPDPDFHVIYCTSKISRIFLDNSDYLIGSENSSFETKVTELIRRAKNLLPLVDSINYTYTFNENNYNIELVVTITKLVNKRFLFNITLNI